MFSIKKVNASQKSVQVEHLYLSYFLFGKNPDFSEVQRYILESLFKYHLTRDNSIFYKFVPQGGI